MKNPKILLLILILGIAFLSVQLFSFSFGHTSSNVVVSSSTSNDPSMILVKLDKPYEIVYHGLNEDINPVVDSSAYRIDVFVEKNTSFGILRYLPIYKPVSFESRVSYKWNNPLSINNIDSLNNEFGEFAISGNCKLLGSYTKTNAEQLINEQISKGIISKIENDIKNRLNP